MEEEQKESFKKQIYMYLIALSMMVTSYVFYFRMSFHLGMIVYWLVYLCQYFLFKRINKRELILLICIIILNVLFDGSYFYLRLDILMGSYFTILIIYYISKSITRYKLQKIITIALVIPLVLSVSLYLRKDKLIKDRGLEKCIKGELQDYGIIGEIGESDLRKITSLFISRRDQVYNLDGIEHLENLKRLYLMDAKGIRNLSSLALLSKLKELSLNDIKMSNLSDSDEFTALEELDINYSKINSILLSKNFPNIKRLDIQGVELRDLSFFKQLQSLEELRLSFNELDNLRGIEELENLKRLDLYKTEIRTIDKVKESESLETIVISGGDVGYIEELKESSDIKIIVKPDITSKLFP
ncbi:leucine-rich repeat domain-containing protein [Wukongibacter sp. M2B1]|uniref:leucine-rich repeat domain-containing protein n=1 Tax=Wukongibacter sp. M2B1 TaxID=3088895 RepID=UPI003D7A82E3